MHVTRVELDNIKSYEHADFRFEPGTTAIVGKNGAGKTTILEAIAWTLFDNLEYSKDDFLRRGAKKGSVRVTFQSDADERQYTVYRDTGTGYYIVDTALGVRLAERKKDVTDFIYQLLGVEPGTDLKSLFRNAVGVPQGTFTAVFLQPSVQRKAAFDRLLKVEEYREGAERLRDTVTLIRERIADARGRIGIAEGQLARYTELAGERTELVDQETSLDNTLDATRARVTAYTEQVTGFDRTERAVTEARLRQERLAVESETAARRLRDANGELSAARSAVERQQATADDHARHLAALAALRSLEIERADRDRLRAASDEAARRLLTAEHERERAVDQLEGAECARDAALALAPDVERQLALEQERERSREMRARMVSARDAAARLDRDLQLLREQHKTTSERLRQAERGSGAQNRIDELEIERIGLDNQLAEVREAATAHKHLSDQHRELQTEVARLRRVVATLEAETIALADMSARASRLPAIESEEREIAHTIANLRAELRRDERMSEEVAGGLCPILSQRCLNIGEDETLDSYFTFTIAANRDRLRASEQHYATLAVSLRETRESAARLAGLARIEQNLRHERELLTSREAALQNVEASLAGINKSTRAQEQEIKNRLSGVEGSLKTARDEAILFAESVPLRTRLAEIATEGKARRDEQAELLAAAAGIDTLDADIRANEEHLHTINDPRARAAALRRDADREPEFRRLATETKSRLLVARADAERLARELERFITLDERLRATHAERDQTAAGYQDHLAASALASALPARESLVAEIDREIAALDQQIALASKTYERLAASYDRDAHARARVDLQTAREQVAAAEQQLKSTRERLARIMVELERLDQIRLEMGDELREKSRLERLQESVEFVRETLKKAGPLVTESYLFNISIDANNLFREITGEAGRTLRWTRDYEVILEEAGHERSFANLSGGEQMVAALSIRLALLKQLSDIRLAIFDEPTTNMDAERRTRLAEAIGQVRHFDQLFVISHDDTFEEDADHVVNVGMKDERKAMKEEAGVAA